MSCKRGKSKCNCLGDFFRKFAYNLGITWGNSSQADVKIISCIPIDVTDLQQKILSLERQLDKKSYKNVKTVNTALYSPQLLPPPPVALLSHSCEEVPDYDVMNDVHETTSTHNEEIIKRSTMSFHMPPKDIRNQQNYLRSTIPEKRNQENQTNILSTDLNSTYILNDKNDNENNKNDNENIKYRHSNNVQEKRFLKKKNKLHTQLVYYAQTLSSPFSKYNTPNESVTKANECHAMSREYLEDMIRKQYKPKPILCSSTSEFSSPICRDLDKYYVGAKFDSDMCSCCHGMFRDIDYELTAQHRNRLRNAAVGTIIPARCSRNDYYNSSYYDIVPVKEKPVKHKPIKKYMKDSIGVMYCAEKTFPNGVHHSHYINAPQSIRKSLPIDKRNQQIGNLHTLREERLKHKVGVHTTISTIRNDHINISNRLRRAQASNFVSQKIITPVVLHKNASCLTYDVNNMECQTIASDSLQIKLTPQTDVNKTEATLNQIKTILLSVLTEVKTNSPIKRISQTPQRDAIVQKDLSQNIMRNSSKFIQSYTYSPYNMTPNCMNPYQQPLPSDPFCCPTVPYPHLRYFQNYPILIQTPPGKINNSFGQPQVTRSVCTFNATDVTTNTDLESNNYKKNEETYKLIKKIYESITMNVDIRTENAPNAEHKRSSSSIEQSESKKSLNKISKAMSSLIYSRDIKETASTESRLKTKIYNNDNNTHPIFSTIKIGHESDHNKVEQYLENKNILEMITEKQNNDDVTLTNASESSDTDTEVQEAPSLVLSTKTIKKEKKQGLFKKMLNSVNFFKTKDSKDDASNNSESEDTDSSDDHYATFNENKKSNIEASKPTNYSNDICTSKRLSAYNNQKIPVNYKRAPYLEQEYRRSWEENLMYHNEKPRNSSTYVRPSALSKRSPLVVSRNSKIRRSLGTKTTTVNHRPVRLETLQNKQVSLLTKPRLQIARKV